MKKTSLAICGLFLLTTGLHAQGFVNLDFESAKIQPIAGSPYFPYGIASTNALPGWTVFSGASSQPDISYNDPAIGSTWVNLWATNGQNIEGSFSVLLQGGLSASFASIVQTGAVPASAQSILFKAQYFLAPGVSNGISLSLGGQNIPFYSLSTGPNYTLYGGDISAFAGLTEALAFTAYNVSQDNDWNIDSIVFSTSPISEPTAFSLFALGGLLIGCRQWRNSKR